MDRARPAGAALLSGVALSLAFPEPDLAPVAWIALIPFLLLCRAAGAARGFGIGFTFGVGFFGALVAWVSLVGWVAWGVLVAVEALFIAGFGVAWALLSRGAGIFGRIVYPAALWVLCEYLRSNVPVGGFTWGQLAQSQHNIAALLKPASLGGAWLVAFVVVLINAALIELVGAWRQRRPSAAAWPAVVISAVILVVALTPANGRNGRRATIAIVQGNVPREFTRSTFEKQLVILANHVRLTTALADHAPSLVVWPESSVGLDPDQVPTARRAIADAARAVAAPMVIGADRDVGEDRYAVTALEVAPDGRIVDRYQKTHLVPFGEYVPGRRVLGWIPLLDQVPRDAVPGTEAAVFEVPALPGPVAPVISFEGDFGSLVRTRIDKGGRLLIVATNTSTWGDSWASAQHLAMSQVRAAENGVWVAHAAISGISAFVAPDGSVVSTTPLWKQASLVEAVTFPERVTIYARVGDWVPVVALIICLQGAARALKRARSSSVA